ncbi:MAG: hypothetical protein KAR13_04890, partial [Desulfobulbaceae bacterium]|nr:hypothetical protein [Desulfobulbaceae bacterium]
MHLGIKEIGHRNIFESFTDVMLCICIVLIVFVLFFALNVYHGFTTKDNEFSGGIKRPELFIEAYPVDYSKTTSDSEYATFSRNLYQENVIVEIHLSSPSFAQARTTVKEGKTISLDGTTFSGRLALSLPDFLGLASAINPGRIKIGDDWTSLLMPRFGEKRLLAEDRDDDGLYVVPSQHIALNALRWAWPIMESNIYIVRSYEEYRDSRTLIYFESEAERTGKKWILIGNSKYPMPDAVRNGSLDFLAGLSSGVTRMIYLGEYSTDYKNKTNTRIEFLEANGFFEAAEYYRNYVYQPEKLLPDALNGLREFLPVWEELTESDRQGLIKQHGNEKKAAVAFRRQMLDLSADAY